MIEIETEDGRILAVECNVWFGSPGNGMSIPPEPGAMDILTVTENGQIVTNIDLDEIESRCWDSLSSGVADWRDTEDDGNI